MIVELEKLTVKCLLERTFEKFGSLPSIAFVGEQPIVYLQLKQQIQEAAGALAARGIRKGDRVAIMGENCPNWVIAYLAVTSMGAVAVPILTGFPETDTRHILRNSEAQGIYIEPKQRPKLEGLDDETLKFVCDLEDFTYEDRQKHRPGLIEKTLALFKRGRQRSAADGDTQLRFPEVEPDDLAVIIYTSGTTGHSKGVMLSHRNITFDVVNGIERFPINSDDRFLSILPLAHTFEATGGMLCPIAIGASVYYMRGLPTPQKLLAAMESVKPTAVLTVPLVIDKIFRKKILPQIQGKMVINKLYPLAFFRRKLHQVAGRKLVKSFGNKLRFFMFGGASLNEDVEVFLRDAGISYSTGYGMTETAPIMTINPFGQVKVGSCGKPIPGIEMKIHEPDTASGIGEIVVRGPIVMSGYYKNPDASAEVFMPGGWLKTGDLGYFDGEGYLFIKGRSKNVIIGPSGENIYPEAIEQKILQEPYFQEVVVFESGHLLQAKAYLDYDVLDREFERNKLNDAEARKLTEEILEQARQRINLQLPAFSQISRIMEHPEPFEKTPTNKVKRYLYITRGK
ncbi:MAG: AMP-binding protein [Acidobacteria bacterium]|jgi:long-chain acyl-CoA synthetase|nr:AMP-binding protein [Acidobacteriota bacterium]